MAGETNKVRIKAVAKLEKYDDNCKKEDILQGTAKPYETLSSEDILVDPTVDDIKRIQDMGVPISKEVWNELNKK